MKQKQWLTFTLTAFLIVIGAVGVLNAQATLVDTFAVDEAVHDIVFRNSMEGYAIVDERVLVTTDGGVTWAMTMPLVFRPPFRSITLFGEKGIIIGDMYGGVHVAVDPEQGWKTFQLEGKEVAIENRPIIEVQAVNGAHWVAITDSTIYATKDSGATFVTTHPSEHRFFAALDITSADVMHVAQDIGDVLRSTDGGESWNSLNGLINDFGFIYDVRFISPDTGFVASWYPWNLFTTIDGGATWTAGPFEYPTSIAITPSGTGAYTTSEYLRVTHDYGMTWSDSIQLREPGDDPFNNDNTQKVVTAGERGLFLLMTETDSGKSTIARIDIPSGVNEDLRMVPDALDLADRWEWNGRD